MIRTIIIEDELNVREALKKMLQIISPAIQIIGESAFVKEGSDLIKKHQPDLVFMDVELEDGTGFDILNQLETIEFSIIFTTAYNQFAIKAFKYSAVDYLLKPLDPEELKNAVDRAFENVAHSNKHKELLKVLQNNINKKEEEKIVLKTTEQRHIISVKNIIRLEADGAYTNFFTVDKKIIISRNLKFYQDILNKNFIRIHQSHLINKQHIKNIKKTTLIMSNGNCVPIATRKKTEILKLITS